jgi:hypothetical protein
VQSLGGQKSSWLPNWSQGPMAAGLLILRSPLRAQNHAAGDPSINDEVFHPDCDWILKTEGSIYDEITHLHSPDSDPLSSWQSEFQVWDELVRQ